MNNKSQWIYVKDTEGNSIPLLERDLDLITTKPRIHSFTMTLDEYERAMEKFRIMRLANSAYMEFQEGLFASFDYQEYRIIVCG